MTSQGGSLRGGDDVTGNAITGIDVTGNVIMESTSRSLWSTGNDPRGMV